MPMDNFDSPFLYNRPKIDTESLKKAIVSKLIFSIGRSPQEASQRDWLNATLSAVLKAGLQLPAKLVQKILAEFITFLWNSSSVAHFQMP